MDDLKDQLQRHEGLLENLTISIGKRIVAFVFYMGNILNLGLCIQIIAFFFGPTMHIFDDGGAGGP